MPKSPTQELVDTVKGVDTSSESFDMPVSKEKMASVDKYEHFGDHAKSLHEPAGILRTTFTKDF